MDYNSNLQMGHIISILPPLAYPQCAGGSSQDHLTHSNLPIVSHLTQNKIKMFIQWPTKAENDLASLCPN